MKKLFLIISILHMCLSTQADDTNRLPDRDRFGFYIAKNRNWTRIPFELHSNLIIVRVLVNDSDTLRFILDTGVSNTIITNPDAFKHRLPTLARKVNITGAGEGGHLTASIAINNRIKMGGMQAAHHNVLILDEDVLKLSEYVGTPIDGIFGYELFANFVVNIDFQRRELLVMTPKSYRYNKRKGDQYPLTIQDTKAYTDVMAVFEGNKLTPLRVVLDTGAGHALLLDRSRNLTDMPLPAKVIRAQLGRGLNGVINGNLGRIQKIRFGRYEVNNVLASFPDSIAFGMKLINMPNRQGNVGCELLRRFNVTFNYPDQYMVLKPVKRMMREQFEHDMSGVALRARGDQLRTYYVDKLIPGSPAALAGLREGDEVLFVDSYSAQELTVSDIYKLLQKGEGKEISLLVRRSGQLVMAQFALKRII
jgi:hypothetical protein